MGAGMSGHRRLETARDGQVWVVVAETVVRDVVAGGKDLSVRGWQEPCVLDVTQVGSGATRVLADGICKKRSS